MKSKKLFGLENAGWPAVMVERTGKVRRANGAAIQLFGPALEGEEAALSTIWSPENGNTPEQFLVQWEQSPVQTASLRLHAKNDQTLSIHTSICSVAFGDEKGFLIQMLPDESRVPAEFRRRNGEVNTIHQQKLECALQLARTVALDFNNALTSILGHTSLILTQMESDHPWRGSLLEVEKSAAKAAEISNDLGTFSSQEKAAPTQAAANLNSLVKGSIEYFRQISGDDQPNWVLELERDLFAAKFDEAKMQQALLKILENAVQALPGSGLITVQTRNLELAQVTQDWNVELKPGAYVCVEVIDNGCGIEPDVLPRIFEPFFTTKTGEHRGLGLAWVYGIVTNHGGRVVISSQPGVGTSVRLYLPAENRVIREKHVSSADLTGNQTVLLVDDEDLLLTMGQTILSAYGYRVLTANNGQKALDMLTQNDLAVDLVITDMVMPVISGRELVERIRQIAPDLKVLCTSGYVWPASQQPGSDYLQKPFTSQDLLLKVKQLTAGTDTNRLRG
jgi:signal transduction histidine kinase/CheY-like chemotaxis protein